MDIFGESLAVRFADIDQSDTLTVASTFDLFQETAINHAELLGVGREAMKQSGRVWILSRLSVFMERRPRYREKVTVRSWPRGYNRLFAIRDYDIRSEAGSAGAGTGTGTEAKTRTESAGEVLVRGRSAWLIVDLERRRPLRPQTAMADLPLNEGIDALPGPAPGNEPPPSLGARTFGPEWPRGPRAAANPTPRRALYSDLDFNGHVNNTRYVQWIEDLMAPGALEGAARIRLDINYLSEVRYGETIGLYAAPLTEPCADSGGAPNPCREAFAIEGRREETPVFRAELRLG
ncbi:MAG: acyl-ACP thioesterase [Treponema sp.]|jgi:acyl-ACP thioesterase|nr:acyl-ACP thioesterase [Treponema sp.]